MINNKYYSQEHIFIDGSQYFNSLMADIDSAKRTIELEIYKFSHDQLGKTIATKLAQAANRGVKVRVLVDGAGSLGWDNQLTNLLESNRVQTRIFHPLPWRLWHWQRAIPRSPFLLKALYLFIRMNSRLHRKCCIIDDSIIYVGSFNIHMNHISQQDGGKNWRDTGVRLHHVDVVELKNAFETTWTHTQVKEQLRDIFRQVNRNPRFRLNNSWLRRRILYKNLLRRIKQSHKRIWITNAYFVPDSRLLTQIRNAARRGVDVRILLPQKSDVFIMPWASTSFYHRLLKAGVRIFEYKPTMLHAKTLMIDDWIIVGSSNLNHRSLLHDLEVDINIRLPESKNLLERQFISDLENSEEIQWTKWSKRPWRRRIIGQLILYLKYWI